MTFFQELKRRNVIRIGVLYLVSAWLLLQLTDVMSSLLPVPAWTGSLVVLLLVLGFFPVLIFAWVYEMTPDGLRREKDVVREQSITPETGHKINTLIVVLLALAIAGLAADRLIPETATVAENPASDVQATTPDHNENSIAVLPFADLSADRDQQYFTDGLTEELLNLLFRVEGITVASRTSSFAFRNSALPLPEISKALNVGHILEGSVRKDGDRVRITAQLIEAATDRHLWSENFDRDLTDIFAIQDEIANAIVGALARKIGLSQTTVTVEAVTENLDAYELYLSARELFLKRERLEDSVRLYREAIALDPGFARAWEGLAASEVVAERWLPGGEERRQAARDAAEKALQLNPDLSMPFSVLGVLATTAPEAVYYHRAAIEKDRRNATGWLWLGIAHYHSGYLGDAVEALEQCLAIDPAYLNCRQILASVHQDLGEMDRALELLGQTLEVSYHSTSHAFVPYLVRNSHRLLAVQIADAKLNYGDAPVVEWIRAIENPGDENTSGYARLTDWEKRTKSGYDLTTIPHVFLAFGAFDRLTGNPAAWVSWHPDAAEYRRSRFFERSVRESGRLQRWKAEGFPPQCRPVGDDDFDCTGAIVR